MLAHRNSHSVDLKRRPPKSLPAASFDRRRASTFGTRRAGLRRPRFSFFRFTCQTSRNLAAPSPSPGAPHGEVREREAAEARTSDMAIAHGRMIHRLDSEGLLKTRHRAKRRRAKKMYIGFGQRRCQRLRSRNGGGGARKIRQFLPAVPCAERCPRALDCADGRALRRTTATFLGRPLGLRVGRMSYMGLRRRHCNFEALDGSAALTVRNRREHCVAA
jgi:hypothetical protein